MIDLVLVLDVRAMRGMGRGLSDHHIVLCKVRLVGAWMMTEVVNGARRIRIEKMKEHQYREGYARSLEGKRVERDGENDVQYMWEWVK